MLNYRFCETSNIADDPGTDESETIKEKHVLDLLTNRKLSAEDTLEALGMSLDEMVNSPICVPKFVYSGLHA